MIKGQKTEKFAGFYVPNSTPVPDNFFDELLAYLSESELKVVLYVMRRTFGFKKHDDNISLNQMLYGIVKKDGTRLDRGTGLSKPAITKAVKSLVTRGVLIVERRFDKKGSNEPTNYHLNLIEISPSKYSLQGGVVKKINYPLVKNLYPQDTVLQDTENTVNVNVASKKIEKTDLRKLPDIEQDKDKTKYLATEIYRELGDKHSQGFYYLVAAKVPEHAIRQALAEIKQGGARSPAAVFTSRMKIYAAETISRQRINGLYSTADLAEKMQLR
ncbi:MAG: replication protein [Candidatus Sungbacteria bacterium]|nr:replication protein [Candidatus Sungbacteria bacterium]